jgi:hypothetical protein
MLRYVNFCNFCHIVQIKSIIKIYFFKVQTANFLCLKIQNIDEKADLKWLIYSKTPHTQFLCRVQFHKLPLKTHRDL